MSHEPRASLASRLARETGASEALARSLLEAEGGDFDRAVEAFRSSQGEARSGAPRGEQEDIQHFMALTGCADEGHSRFCLEACAGNLERAVNMYMSEITDLGATQGHPSLSSASRGDQVGSSNGNGSFGGSGAGQGNGAGQGYVFGLLGGLMRIPLTLLRKTLGLVQSVVMFTVLVPLSRSLGLGDDYQRSHAEENPVRQARQFSDRFEFLYGSEHPPFVDQSWRDAAARAHRELKFLWVYVHAPNHEDTDTFCREVLCAPEVVAFLSTHFVCWGGDVRQSEAFRLAASLGATTYPFQCLLAFSGSRTQPVSSMQGCMSSRELINAMQQALSEQGALLVAERADRERVDHDRQLRQEQDMEYERSLENDKRLEAERKQQQAAEAVKRQEEMEEEARKRREIEAEELRAEQMVAAIERRKQQKRQRLKAEPPSGGQAAQIRIRMLDGSNHLRRFNYTDKVQDIFDYVDSLEDLGILNYSLVRMFPRKAFGKEGREETLVEAGLVPDSLLLLKSDDD